MLVCVRVSACIRVLDGCHLDACQPAEAVRQISAKRNKELLDREVTKRLAIARDNGRCVLCGNTGNDVNEIVPRSHFGSKTKPTCYLLKNMAVLCRECHMKRHNPQGRHDILVKLQARHGYDYSDEPWRYYLEFDGKDE